MLSMLRPSITDWSQAANGAVELHEILGGHLLCALQYFAGAFVALAYLLLLFVGQGHDAQRENFVDLGAVEERSRALRGDLRIIVKNNGRREHAIRRSL